MAKVILHPQPLNNWILENIDIFQLFNGCGCNRLDYLPWGPGNDQRANVPVYCTWYHYIADLLPNILPRKCFSLCQQNITNILYNAYISLALNKYSKRINRLSNRQNCKTNQKSCSKVNSGLCFRRHVQNIAQCNSSSGVQ